MTYTKTLWVDQDVERPRTYEVTTNQDSTITLTDSFGLVTELGTPVNAQNMNNIENGIKDLETTKADIDLSNVNSTGLSYGAKWAMPSSRRNNLTIGASGSTYKAPATGWFYLLGAVSSYNDWAALISYSKHYAVGNGGGTYQLIMPVVRGDVITLEYTAGATLTTFRFIYSMGEV